MGSDGSGLRQVSERGGWPVWWPDGSRVGFLVAGPDGNQEIHTVRLADGASAKLEGLSFSGLNYPFDVSPDGRFLATSNSTLFSADVWLLEPGA